MKFRKELIPVYVAVVGVLGTIIVAMINLMGMRMQFELPLNATQTAQALLPQPASAIDTNSTLPLTEVLSLPAITEEMVTLAAVTSETCLQDYFLEIDAALRISLEVGGDVRFELPETSAPGTAIGPLGVTLTHYAVPFGGLQLLAFPDSQTFKVVSMVGASCETISGFNNLTRPSNDTLQNWDVLGMELQAGRFSLRMGWMGQTISLLFKQQ